MYEQLKSSLMLNQNVSKICYRDTERPSFVEWPLNIMDSPLHYYIFWINVYARSPVCTFY